MSTDALRSSDEAERIDERVIGQMSFNRYEDGDILFHEKGGEGSYESEGSIVLAPPQLGVVVRQWPVESGESIDLGTDSLDRPATLSRKDSTVEVTNSEVSIELPVDAMEEVVEVLHGWNYHQFRARKPNTVELDADHVQSLLEFVWDHHPRNSTGWVGGLAEALVGAQTELYSDQVSIRREPLEVLIEWVKGGGTDHPSTKGAARDIDRCLADFGSEIVAVDQEDLERLVQRVEDDSTFSRDTVDSDVIDALAEVNHARCEMGES